MNVVNVRTTMNDHTNIKLDLTIPAEQQGKRLDQALAELLPSYSRSRIKTWIEANQVMVDGQPQIPRYKVQAEQKVHIEATLPKQDTWEAQAIPLSIVYEDKEMLIINKPAGLTVHPGAGQSDQTLLNALLHHAPELAHIPRAGIIHRLDKDTTGLMVVAKTLSAHHFLVDQLQQRAINREYLALVYGEIIAGGTIDAPIGRHPTQRTHMAIVETGRSAVTHYRIAKRYHGFTLLRVSLETGRTHQIRVHLSHIGHPIVGDKTYGKMVRFPKGCPEELKQALQQFKRQALHATQLNLEHPVTHESLTFTAEIPADFQALIHLLK